MAKKLRNSSTPRANQAQQYLEQIQTISEKRDQENLKHIKSTLNVTSGRLYFFAFILILAFLVYFFFFTRLIFTDTFKHESLISQSNVIEKNTANDKENTTSINDGLANSISDADEQGFIDKLKEVIAKRRDNKINLAARNRILRNVITTAPRGQILDNTGHILAMSVPYKTFGIDAKVFLDPHYARINQLQSPVFQALAQAFNFDPKVLHQRLETAVRTGRNSRYILLDKQVSPTISSYIQDLHIPGLTYYVDYRRFYPYGDATAQLLGLLGSDGRPLFGIERLANQDLESADGHIQYEKNFSGQIVSYLKDKPAQPGKDIKLTIDINLQMLAYQALSDAIKQNKAKLASAVLVDVKTGKILVMANAPSFNPNDRSGYDPATLQNYAINSLFEPGSTVKPFTVYAGLQAGIIKPNSIIDTKPYKVGRFTIRDVGYYKELSVRDVLAYSSNVGASTISLNLPSRELLDTFKSVGFGEPTNLGFVGEQTGRLPKAFNHITDQIVLSYGYAQLVTPLQLAHAYATLGDMGVKRPLVIFDDQKLSPGKQVLDPKTVHTVIELMKGVAEHVTSASIPNYHVSIKTGTAKRSVNKQYVDKYISYTAGVAPSTNPRYALVVIIDNPTAGKYYGGAIAAPVWHTIMQDALRYTNVPEDNMNQDRIIINHTVAK